jgi:hypothetical protein
MNNLLTAIMTKTSGSALSTAVGGRIFEGEAPDGTEFPYIVISIVNDTQIDTFLDKLDDITIQFSLYSISKGLTEITGMFANLKTLFDDAVLTITSNYHILISRQGLTTMFDDITTPLGTVGLRHWAVDYWIITEKA